MVVDDIQFMNALRGKRIKLTLKTASYLGVVQRVNSNKTLVLSDVVSVSNGCKFPGSKMFFGHEIVNVKFTDEAKSDGAAHDLRADDRLTVEKFQPYRKTLTMDFDEEYINFVVIDEFHEKFGPAVMHIKKQSVIGVGADGVDIFQHGRLCWLQIATKNKVYLFDILLLGPRAFKNGLSMIMENKDILKVIHDCRAIAGCLIAQYGVKLTNVFDTQVADVMCFYSETGGFLPDRVSTLQEVVHHHLKVPSSQLSSLQMKSQLTEEAKEMWYKRPCSVTLLKVMAVSVIHLQPLRLVLLDTFMTDYMATVDSYLNSSYYEPGELGHVSMESVLALPRELRKLQQMHQQRRELAAKHYHVTEQGLLARFNSQTKSPSHTITIAEENSQTQSNSFGLGSVELPSPRQTDPSLYHQPTSSPECSSASPGDVHASPTPQAQATGSATLSNFRQQLPTVSPQSGGRGRGSTEVLMDTLGKAKSFGEDRSSLYSLPAIGRGFLLQMPSAYTPIDSTGTEKSPGHGQMIRSCPSLAPSLNTSPQLGTSATDFPRPTSDFRGELSMPTPQSSSASLRQSFWSFRYSS